ncbi:MAG: response regulator [Thermacetogeniaceae bacterium]|jgi:DNA-binding response OmpR family regulator
MISDDRYLLIVDDMRVICELLTDVLTAEGFMVQASMSGEQAIDTIRARTPALIIIDQVMPGKDGLQTLRDVQGLISGVPVIMISGYVEEKQDVIEARRKGLIRHFISKPFDMRYLIRLVKEIIPPPPGPGEREVVYKDRIPGRGPE